MLRHSSQLKHAKQVGFPFSVPTTRNCSHRQYWTNFLFITPTSHLQVLQKQIKELMTKLTYANARSENAEMDIGRLNVRIDKVEEDMD